MLRVLSSSLRRPAIGLASRCRHFSSVAPKGLQGNGIMYTDSHMWIKVDSEAEEPLLHIGVSNALKPPDSEKEPQTAFKTLAPPSLHYLEKLGLVASVQLAGEVGLTMPRGVLIGIITHTVGGNDESEDSGMDEISGSLRQTEIISPIAGEITAINEDIERDAEVFLSPQPEHSWLYKLKLTDENRTSEGFLNAEEYRNYLIKIGWLA